MNTPCQPPADVAGELRKREECYRILSSTMSEAFALHEIICDENGKPVDFRLLEVNAAFGNMMGSPAADLVGKTILEVAPNIDKGYIALCGEVALAGKSARMDNYVSSKGRYYEAVAYPAGPRQFIVTFLDITERKQAEKAFQEESIRRRILFEYSPDGILIIEPATARFLEFNTAAHEQLGYSREEFARLSIFDVEVIESSDETRRRIGNVIEHGKADFDTKQRTKSGEIRDVHVTAQSIDVLGKQMYVCTWRDITERKRTEIILRQTEQSLRDIINCSNNFIWEVDAQGRYVQVAGNIQQILGYTLEEFIGKTPFDFMEQSEADRVRIYFQQILSSRAPIKDLENIGLAKDGSNVYLLTNGVPILDEHGNLLGYRGVDKDITERKKAEAALLASEEKFRSIVESSPTAMYLYRLEPDGRLVLTDTNPAADRIIRIAHKPLIGKTIEEAFPALAATDVPERYRKIARGEIGSQSFEITYAEAGERFRGVYSVYVFRTGPNTIVVDFVDISERKAMEEELKGKTAFLESQVEAALDGLLIVGAQGQRVLINRKLIEMFKVPEHVLASPDKDSLLLHIADQAKHPQQFVETVRALRVQHDRTERIEIAFKDERIIDRYTSPVIDKNGAYCGRIWSFRDITDMKQTERRLMEKVQELETFNKFAVNRELKMIELKEKIAKLELKLQR